VAQRGTSSQVCRANRRVRHSCGMGVYLFSIFVNDSVEYIEVKGLHAPVIGGLNTCYK
jgi:hypothetical protein